MLEYAFENVMAGWNVQSGMMEQKKIAAVERHSKLALN